MGNVINFSLLGVIETSSEYRLRGWCPALRGCNVFGETEEEVLGKLKNAATAYVESLAKHGDPIPIGLTPFPKLAGEQKTVDFQIALVIPPNLEAVLEQLPDKWIDVPKQGWKE